MILACKGFRQILGRQFVAKSVQVSAYLHAYVLCQLGMPPPHGMQNALPSHSHRRHTRVLPTVVQLQGPKQDVSTYSERFRQLTQLPERPCVPAPKPCRCVLSSSITLQYLRHIPLGHCLPRCRTQVRVALMTTSGCCVCATAERLPG